MRTVLNAEGFITKELHAEFWRFVPEKIKNDEKIRLAFVRLIDSSIASGVRFQQETWASIKASLEARRVVKTSDYERAKQTALNAMPFPEFKSLAEK